MERQTNQSHRPGLTAAPVFLVLERDPLIAEDMVDSLQEILPCRVLHANDESEIRCMLRGEDMISAAFLNLPFAQVVEMGLDEMLNAHGARIILTVGEDDQAEAVARGWGMLVRPFTQDMIRDLVVPRPLS